MHFLLLWMCSFGIDLHFKTIFYQVFNFLQFLPFLIEFELSGKVFRSIGYDEN